MNLNSPNATLFNFFLKSKPIILIVIISLFTINTSYGQSIVEENGRLKVTGNKVTSQNGTPLSLAGNSIFWSNFNEGAKFYNAQTVNHVAGPDWNSDIIRASMGVEDYNGYISNPAQEKAKVIAVVDAAIAAGIYVIIDWHSHNAEDYQNQAVQFFSEMSSIYGNSPNVIYELYNEPINQQWPEIKSYAEVVTAAIRSNDPDNLIIVGTPFYSQKVVDASLNPMTDENVAYTLHFYAGTHGQSLRNEAITAMNNGIALFVTEWGAVNANGDGGAAIEETNRWMDFLKENDISHANWSISDKNEGASVVTSNTGVSGLTSNNLTATGFFIQNIIKNWNDINTPTESLQTAYVVQNIPGIIEAENYDNGGNGTAYYDTSSGNNGGALRNDDVDKEVTSDTDGGHNVGWIADGEWLEYTISTIQAGTYDVTFRVASFTTNIKSIAASLDGNDLGSVSIPNTDGWQNWQDITVSNLVISEGTDKILRLNMNGGSFNLNSITFTRETTSTNTGTDYTIRARGTSGEEQLSISVGGTTIGTFNMQTEFQEYSISSEATGNVRVSYINDSFSRDAEIDWLQIGNTTYQAEEQIINTSVYQNNSCGGSFSQEMHCPGFIDFNTSNNIAQDEVTETTLESAITVYPNPATNVITISSPVENNEIGTVTILNSIGTIIKRQNLQQSTIVDIQNIPSGIYFALISYNGSTIRKTIIKQ